MYHNLNVYNGVHLFKLIKKQSNLDCFIFKITIYRTSNKGKKTNMNIKMAVNGTAHIQKA